MEVLVRIKRLVIARRVEFTAKATEERLRDGLTVEDVMESVVNANAIKKVLRSRSAARQQLHERLYVIESPTFTGVWSIPRVPYVEKEAGRCFMSSSRRSSPSRKTRPTVCPRCGARGVVPVSEDIVLRVGRRRHAIKSVDHERCLRCGERIFGLEVSRGFDATVLRGHRGRVA